VHLSAPGARRAPTISPLLIAAGLFAASVAFPVAGVAPAVLSAQTRSGKAEAARPARGTVSLAARPLVGDTLRLVTEQRIEAGVERDADWRLPSPGATGTTTRPRAASTSDAGPRRGASRVRVTQMWFFARSIVESATDSGTVVRSLPDSLLVLPADGTPRRLSLAALGNGLRVFVAPDGAMRMLDASGAAAPIGATLSGMPAMLPPAPVAVGGSWERDVPMPPLPYTSYRADGVLHTRFRLDSLTREGRMAWVSIEGTLRRDGGGRSARPGTRVVTDGTIRGWLVLDRALGWITDARTVIDAESDIVGAAPDGPPMHTALRITQRMRVR
jgi:hypothetical protein